MRTIPKQLIYALIIAVPFWLIFFNSPFFHNVKMTLMSVVTASVSVARWPVKEAEKLLSYRKSWAENEKLKRETSALKSRAIQLEEMARQNGRYQKLISFRERKGFDAVTAVVVARDPSNWNSSVMINKGRADGLRPGLPVISADGVVGKVAEVASKSAKVILVSDPGFSVAAVNRRSRDSGLVSGSLSSRCRMFYLGDRADFQEGDEVITSELSQEFPPGILVGEVTHVSPPANQGGLRVEISPAVDVGKIEEVLVIK